MFDGRPGFEVADIVALVGPHRQREKRAGVLGTLHLHEAGQQVLLNGFLQALLAAAAAPPKGLLLLSSKLLELLHRPRAQHPTQHR